MDRKSLAILILTIILSLFIVTVVVLLSVFIPIFEEETEDKIKYYSDLSEHATKGQVVFLGDSITEFYRTSEFFHEYSPYNRGIAGDTTDGVLARLQDNVIVLEPKKVFLCIGTNDLARVKKDKVNYIVNNIIEIVTAIENSLPDTKVYVVSILPVNRSLNIYSRYVLKSRNNEDIDSINERLKEYCEENDVTFIDINTHLKDEKGNLKKEYTLEGLHISFKGYQVITELLKPYLEE